MLSADRGPSSSNAQSLVKSSQHFAVMMVQDRNFVQSRGEMIKMWRKFSRSAYTVLAWGFAACVAVQTFLAGLAVFTDPSQWGMHVMFVHLFEYLPLLMLLFAFAGKLPGSEKWLCAALFGLMIAQYATANIPGAGALHPVIALALFWLSLRAARRPAGSRMETAAEVPPNG
jgi:hypothetical protein